MAFASRDQIRQAITAGRVQRWHPMKLGSATPVAAGNWVTFYLDAGSPGAAANPTTYANCTDLSGSVNFTNVSPGNRYLTDVSLLASQDCTIMIYDRLGHIGAIDVWNGTADRTVTSSALPRSMGTNDLNNVECWVEVTTATDGFAPVIDLKSYTNQAGTAARAGTSITFPAAATNVGWMSKLPLQAGDKGVQAIASLGVSTAADTAGVVNVILLRPLFSIACKANELATREVTTLPRVYDGSSICFAALATGTTAINILGGELTFAYDA